MTINYGVADGIARLQIDRPERRNALDAAMRFEMAEHIEQAAADPEVRVLVLCGTPGQFCSGADLGQFAGESLPSSRQRMKRGGLRIVHALTTMEKPVIAAVDGPAIGLGWALALACDHIIASTSAWFALTYSKIGLVPDCGAAHMLVRNIGLLRAKELIFSGRKVDASEALGLGLVTETADPDTFEEQVNLLARRYAAGPTFAFGLTKLMLHRAIEPTLADFLDIETLIAPQMRFTDDYQEGTAAFREKRTPQFKGT